MAVWLGGWVAEWLGVGWLGGWVAGWPGGWVLGGCVAGRLGGWVAQYSAPSSRRFFNKVIIFNLQYDFIIARATNFAGHELISPNKVCKMLTTSASSSCSISAKIASASPSII